MHSYRWNIRFGWFYISLYIGGYFGEILYPITYGILSLVGFMPNYI